MMKIKKKLSIATILFGVCLAFAVGFAKAEPTPNVVAEEIVLQETLAEKYAMHETVSIPKAQLGDEEADMVVVFPSGVAQSNYNITLTEAGKYTVVYSVKNGTELLTKTLTFDVANAVYSLNGEKASATYGTFTNGTVNKTGLKVALGETEEIIFNQPIDLNGATSGDTIIEFFSTPADLAKVEHKKIYIQLIDIKNPDSYVTIMSQAAEDEWAYSLVAGNGQKLTGRADNGTLHIDNAWGMGVYYAFYGEYTEYAPKELGSRTLKFSYDEREKQFFVNGKKIADLDSPEDYYSSLWNGFTSNRVYVKVWCDDYYKDVANVMFLKVGDADLNATEFADVVAPAINVELDAGKIPLAKVGGKYKIFAASAEDDIDLVSEIKTKVYYLYDGKRIDVSVENGYFDTKYETTYYIEYSTTDRAGNAATRTIEVVAQTSGISMPNIATVGERDVDAYVGETVSLADYVVSGGSGQLNVETYVYNGKDDVEITDHTFKALSAGTYTVAYKVSDYLEQSITIYYNVEVTISEKPIFLEEAPLPKYFIAGSTYKLENYYAIDYANGGVEVLANVSVEDKNGERSLSQGETYIPEVAKQLDTITVRYTANGTEKIYEVPCILGSVYNDFLGSNEINLQNYFVGDATIEATSSSMNIVATGAKSAWTYANKQLAKDFSINLIGVAESEGFGGVRLTFVDSINPECAIELQLLKTKTTQAVLGTSVANVDFAWKETDMLAISLLDEKISLNGVNLSYTTYLNGKAFNGFPSNYLYVSCEFIDATVGAKYAVSSINGQMTSSYSQDLLAPKIVLSSDATGGAYLPGEVIDIASMIAGDVVSGNTVATVSVYDSTYKYITALDGTVLRNADPSKTYQIVLNDIGRYYIKYVALDENGQVAENPISIRILDIVAPTIEVEKASTSAKVGESFTVAKITVTDNFDTLESLDVYCVVTAPNGKKQVVSLGGSYVPAVAGNYTVTFVAVDTTGNMSTASYIVSVK